MDKANVYIYWRFVLAGVDFQWRKYYVRPLSINKAKKKLAKLRTTGVNVEFCMVGPAGRIAEE